MATTDTEQHYWAITYDDTEGRLQLDHVIDGNVYTELAVNARHPSWDGDFKACFEHLVAHADRTAGLTLAWSDPEKSKGAVLATTEVIEL